MAGAGESTPVCCLRSSCQCRLAVGFVLLQRARSFVHALRLFNDRFRFSGSLCVVDVVLVVSGCPGSEDAEALGGGTDLEI